MWLKEEPIPACPNCGALLIEWLGSEPEDSALIDMGAPLIGVYKCNRCGYEGLPIEFDDIDSYLEFTRAKKEEGKGQLTEQKKEPPLSSKMVLGRLKIGLIILLFLVLYYLILLFITL